MSAQVEVIGIRFALVVSLADELSLFLGKGGSHLYKSRLALILATQKWKW